MDAVKRTRGIRRMIRKHVLGRPVPKYVTAGDSACRRMIRAAQPVPSDKAILDWAKHDLTWEIMCGFWDYQAA